MANFFPLIINPVGNSIQELPATDFLDLSQSGIANSGNITVSGVISATGNITGANINGAHFGSGAGLTSIPGANVTGTVPTATSATTAGTVTTNAQPNITSVGTLTALSVGTGNITGGNLILSGAIVDSAQLDIQTSALNANIVLTPNGTGNVNIGRMSASGNVTAVAYYGNGAPLTELSATNISSGTLAQARLANAAVTLGSTALTLGATVTTVAGLTSVTSTTFVGALTGAATTAGTVTTAAQGNITSVGTLSALAVTGNVAAGGITLSGNTIFSTGSTLTIDPSSPGTTGTVVIAGNLTVQGTTITVDSTTVTINDLLFTVANNAATAAAANGGGIEVGPAGTPYATWTYDQPNSRWSTTLGIAATGNITGGNLSGTNIVGTLTTAAQPNITSVGTLTALNVGTGNITGGNLILTGAIIDSAQLDIQTSAANANIVLTPNGTGNVNIGRMSASGNITAAAYYGSGAGLTSVPGPNIAGAVLNATNASQISVTLASASSAFKVPFANTTENVNGSYGLLQDTESTFTYNPGTNTLVAGTFSGSFSGHGGGLTNIPGANVTGIVASATTATSATSAGSATTAGTVTTAAQGNITSVGTLTGLTVSGTITVNSANGVTAVVNGGTNGVGNIGSAATTFNTVFAKATTAQYADLAEHYAADAEYEAGTVLSFGGTAEVTISNQIADREVAGVVSTQPAYLMNTGLTGHNVVALALMGRVPVKVIGPVAKGDFMIAGGGGHAMACATPSIGTVIGKAIQDFAGESGIIEVLINNQ